MVNEQAKYSMSFTSGTLLYGESLIVANLHTDHIDWKQVRDQVVADNLLQMRTRNASKRICSEIVSRLKLLTPDQLMLLREGSRLDQTAILWLAVCKRYRFIYDFAVEIIHEKYLRLDLALAHADYDIYFDNKAEWHPEVERISEETRQKGRQVVFKMLREAGLLSGDQQIIPALLSPAVIEAIAADNPADFAVFPIPDTLIQEWTV
jgi:hypothetical protein